MAGKKGHTGLSGGRLGHTRVTGRYFLELVIDPMGYDDLITEHYRKEAEACGLGPDSTMRDVHIRETETKFILSEVEEARARKKEKLSILEIGCGNGFLLSLLSEAYPNDDLHGLEFSNELHKLACTRGLSNVTINLGDCRDGLFSPESFDVVITERVLINLLNVKDQQKALGRIQQMLKMGGRYIMVEAFKEPLENLNVARRELMLDDVLVPNHNLYLTKGIFDWLGGLGFKRLNTKMSANCLSTHYFLSRVFHETLRPADGTVRNTEFVKFFDQVLPPAVGDFAPILLMLFEKRHQNSK